MECWIDKQGCTNRSFSQRVGTSLARWRTKQFYCIFSETRFVIFLCVSITFFILHAGFFCNAWFLLYSLGFHFYEDIKYSVFVRAWYSDDTYAIFKSDGVVIVTKRPSVTNVLGSSVLQFFIIDILFCFISLCNSLKWICTSIQQ